MKIGKKLQKNLQLYVTNLKVLVSQEKKAMMR